MKITVEELVELVKICHRKHCCGDDSIGWDELADLLNDTLRNILGEEEYCKYVDSINNNSDCLTVKPISSAKTDYFFK